MTSRAQRALRQRGQASVEFLGMLVLVAGVLVALLTLTNMPGRVSTGVSNAVANVLGVGGTSGGSGTPAPGGSVPGGGGSVPGGGTSASLLAQQVRAAAGNAKTVTDGGGDGWGNPSTLTKHFNDHGSDFGSTSEEQYAQQAQQFLQQAVDERLPMKVDASGVIRVFDPETDTFASYNADGTTRTYFKPTDKTTGDPNGDEYWKNQPGEDPWTEPGGGENGGTGGDEGGSGGSGGDEGGSGGDGGGAPTGGGPKDGGPNGGGPNGGGGPKGGGGPNGGGGPKGGGGPNGGDPAPAPVEPEPVPVEPVPIEPIPIEPIPIIIP